MTYRKNGKKESAISASDFLSLRALFYAYKVSVSVLAETFLG
jgi:hypothetical protein